MNYFIIYETMKYLDYNSILNLKLVNKQFNNDVTNILKRYFNIIPKYITKNRTFEKHGNDIFITLSCIFEDKHLYQILLYLNSDNKSFSGFIFEKIFFIFYFYLKQYQKLYHLFLFEDNVGDNIMLALIAFYLHLNL